MLSCFQNVSYLTTNMYHGIRTNIGLGLHPSQRDPIKPYHKVALLDFDDTIFPSSMLERQASRVLRGAHFEQFSLVRESIEHTEQLLIKYLDSGFKIVIVSRGKIVNILPKLSKHLRFRQLNSHKLPADWLKKGIVEVIDSQSLERAGVSRYAADCKSVSFEEATEQIMNHNEFPGILAVGDKEVSDDLAETVSLKYLHKLRKSCFYHYHREESFLRNQERNICGVSLEVTERYQAALEKTDQIIYEFEANYQARKFMRNQRYHHRPRMSYDPEKHI